MTFHDHKVRNAPGVSPIDCREKHTAVPKKIPFLSLKNFCCADALLGGFSDLCVVLRQLAALKFSRENETEHHSWEVKAKAANRKKSLTKEGHRKLPARYSQTSLEQVMPRSLKVRSIAKISGKLVPFWCELFASFDH